MVVPVLITNCHVLEKLKIGPVIPHTRITRKAMIKAAGVPVAFVTMVENLLKVLRNVFLFFILLYPLSIYLGTLVCGVFHLNKELVFLYTYHFLFLYFAFNTTRIIFNKREKEFVAIIGKSFLSIP